MAIQEKIYIGDEKFLREQEHFCPECAQKLSVCKLSWTVMPKENTSLREYHPEGFKYILYKLKCVSCDKLYSQPEIKRLEKAAADEEARKLAEQMKETDKLCRKTAKKVSKKISKDIEKDIYKQMRVKYGLETPKTPRKTLSDVLGEIKGALKSEKTPESQREASAENQPKVKKEKKHININLSFHKI